MRTALMKAHALVDEALLENADWLAEIKYDGQRLELECDDEGRLFAWSRLGNDIIDSHPWLKDLRPWPGTNLDCELYTPQGSSNRGLEDVEIERVAVFDIMRKRGRDMKDFTYVFRHNEVAEVVGLLRHPRVHVTEAHGLKRELFQRIVAEGGEGIMLKRFDAPYVECPRSSRSWFWQKYKKWLTVEVVIVGCDGMPTKWTVKPGHKGTDGIVYPEGKPSETFLKGYRNLEYGYWTPGGLVKVGTLGLTGLVEELKMWVGKVVEVKCAAVYDSGALRFPGLVGDDGVRTACRPDKRMEEVTLQSILDHAGKHVIKTKKGK